MIYNDFIEAMSRAGLSTSAKIIADGQLHRFYVEGDKTGSKNGWYVLFADGFATGVFGHWKTGVKETWTARPLKYLTRDEVREFDTRLNKIREARRREKEEREVKAKEKARYIWGVSELASEEHPYLMTKNVKSYGLRLYKGALVVPVRNSVSNLQSLQFIAPDGSKRFLSGGRMEGGYFSIGNPQGTICIAEGYATAASIHEATGHAVAVAFNAGNLESVALSLRRKFPDAEILLCADNDENTSGNPGLTKAREAAALVGGLITVAEGCNA